MMPRAMLARRAPSPPAQVPPVPPSAPSLMYWVIAPRDGHARKRLLELANSLFEVVSQRFQPIPDCGVLETSGELSVTLRELAQIGDIGHGGFPRFTAHETRFRRLGSEIFPGSTVAVWETGKCLQIQWRVGTWFQSERPNPPGVVRVSSGHWAGQQEGASAGHEKERTHIMRMLAKTMVVIGLLGAAAVAIPSAASAQG